MKIESNSQVNPEIFRIELNSYLSEQIKSNKLIAVVFLILFFLQMPDQEWRIKALFSIFIVLVVVKHFKLKSFREYSKSVGEETLDLIECKTKFDELNFWDNKLILYLIPVILIIFNLMYGLSFQDMIRDPLSIIVFSVILIFLLITKKWPHHYLHPELKKVFI